MKVKEVEDPSPEPLKSRRQSRTESEPAPLKMAPLDPHPSRSEDILLSRTGVPPEFKDSHVPPDGPSTLASEGSSFDEVAQVVLKDVLMVKI